MVAVVLLLLFLLPAAVKDPLRLFSGNATAAAVFGNNYVHFGFWNHLVPNVEVFLTIGLILSLMPHLMGRRRLFYRVLLFNLLVAPRIISFLWLPFDRILFPPHFPRMVSLGLLPCSRAP